MSKLKEHPRVAALLAFSAAVLVGGVAWAYWPTPAPPIPQSMDDVKALLDSRAYANLTREQKRPYIERVSELMRASDREQRRAVFSDGQSRDAMRDMFMQMMTDRARQFALADAATRQRMIQEDLARMGDRGGRRGGDRQRTEGDGGGDRPELTEEERQAREERREERREEHQNHVQNMVNEGNGQESAWMREYWQAIHEAREQGGR